MVGRRRLRLCFVMSVVLIPSAGVSQTGQNYYTHAARIQEEQNGPAIVDAMAYAYETAVRRGGGANQCEDSQRQPLDVDSSEPETGNVRLHIRPAQQSYFVIVCKPGYVPELVSNADNRSDQSPIATGSILLMRRPE